MTAYLVHDPANAGGSTELARQAGRRRGWLSVRVWPGTRESRVQPAVAILTELGKDPTRPQTTWTADRRWQLAAIWLIAEGITDVALIGTEFLETAHYPQLVALSEYAEAAPTIWLIEQRPHLTKSRRDFIATHRTVEKATVDALAAAARRMPVRTRRRPRPRPQFPAVPADEVPFFIPTCHRVLTPADFKTVAREYTTAARRAEAFLAGSPNASDDEVSVFLRELVGDLASVFEVITRLRGAQCGMLHRERLLKVKPETVIAAHRSSPTIELTEPVVNLLREYEKPSLGAAAALVLAGHLDPFELAELNLGDIAPDGAGYRVTASGRDIRIPPCAAPLLRAQALLIGHCGPSAQFLGIPGSSQRATTMAIRQGLNKVARETGLNVIARLQRGKTGPTWRLSRGFSFQAFGAPTA